MRDITISARVGVFRAIFQNSVPAGDRSLDLHATYGVSHYYNNVSCSFGKKF